MCSLFWFQLIKLCHCGKPSTCIKLLLPTCSCWWQLQSWGQEGSLWWKRFVKEVGLEPGVKARGNYGWWEWWVDKVKRCGRSMNRQDRDRGTGMGLTERTRKLIPETRWGVRYRKKRSVICSEDDVGGRARVTTDEEWVLRGGWTQMRLCRYGGWVVVRSF